MSSAITVNWYHVLDVSYNATETEIKKAYKKMALLHHPDKQGNTAVFAQITRAKNILLDSKSRSDLDAMLTYESQKTNGFLDADELITRLTQRHHRMQEPVAKSSMDEYYTDSAPEKLRSKKGGFSSLKTAMLQETLSKTNAPRLMVSWPCLSENVFDIASLVESVTIKFEISTVANQAVITFDSAADAEKTCQLLTDNAALYRLSILRIGM